VIYGIATLVRCTGRARQQAGEPPRAPPARLLLAGRLARGEIDDDEYRAA